MEALLRQLDRWLLEHRPTYHAALRPGLTNDALDRFEEAHACRLPEPFRALYGWHDGQAEGFLDRLDRFGMFQPLEQVSRTMREMDELAATGDFPHEMWWRAAWIPFLWSGGGSYLCVDLEGTFDGTAGQVLELVGDELERVIWFPDTNAWGITLVACLHDGQLVARDGDVELTDPEGYEAFIAGRYPGYPRAVSLEQL